MSEPIAIVGMACLYPRARGVEAFWNLLNAPDPPCGAADLSDVEVDLAQFGIPPVQRRSMARMQMLMLEAARQCLADAGFPERALPTERTDVIAGTCFGLDRQYANALRVAGAGYGRAVERAAALDHDEAVRAAAPRLRREMRASLVARLGAAPHDRVGEMASTIPARIAAAFRLLGHTITLESADATSFVALEHAMHTLRNGAADAVLVVTGQRHEGDFAADALAAKGLTTNSPLSEGVSALLLKRRDTARHDGDRIYASILEGALRHEPRPGVFRYSTTAEERFRIAKECHDAAAVHPAAVRYIESVGPGIPDVTDAEIRALTRLFNNTTPQTVALNSTRDRLGHTYANAGLAGITATALTLHHATLPPRHTPPPDLTDTPFSSLENPHPWPPEPESDTRYAALCGSALGGTFGYFLLESGNATSKPHDLAERAESDSSRRRTEPIPTAGPDSGSGADPTAAASFSPEHRTAESASAESGASRRHGDSTANAVAGLATVRTAGSDSDSRTAEPIAIVGFGGAFAGGADAAGLWQTIKSGRSGLGRLPESVLDRELYFAPGEMTLTHSYCQVGGAVGVPERPPVGVRITPHRYRAMDAAQRLGLSVADEMLGRYAGRAALGAGTGVVAIGSTLSLTSERLRNAERSVAALEDALAATEAWAALPESGRARVLERVRRIHDPVNGPLSPVDLDGCLASGIAALVVNEFQLSAIPIAVEAACASTLAAVDVAINALRMGGADFAIAGGVEFACNPRDLVLCSALGLLSHTRITPFDVEADGFSPGDGCALFLLKRLSDARRDGDEIVGLIRGVGGSNDAKSLIAPDVAGQVRAMRRAFDAVDFEPAAVDYLEAHGTGTRVGDRVEITAAAQVYGDAERDRPLVIGSVKAVVGHTFAAAGGAGLLEALQAMRAKTFPPNASLRTPNPDLPLADIPAVLPTTAEPWPATPGRPRRAGVSSFGTGGINYHLLLEEYRQDGNS
ncbi:polyketide synthase [Nocardia sp. XZ_19_385]|uniref:beta-ketoacyl [acyl carrier protein] synthase domain-containing protein n=1 Tax=Nocardia sp. XZ_19_385 TaxID=2769488 RepID=UPI001890AD5D|nr:polyketide synthase [Nocardia sp. XZ_19_385]